MPLKNTEGVASGVQARVVIKNKKSAKARILGSKRRLGTPSSCLDRVVLVHITAKLTRLGMVNYKQV